MQRMKQFATSFLATVQINNLIRKANKILKEFGENVVDINSFSQMYSDFASKNRAYRNELNTSVSNEENAFKDQIFGYDNKTKSDEKYLKLDDTNNFVRKANRWDFNHQLVMNESIHVTPSGGTFMTLNGVDFKFDGNVLKVVNPDGTVMYSHDINNNREQSYGEDIFKLTEKLHVAAHWKQIPNSHLTNVGQEVQIPAGFNDVMVVYTNTGTNYSDYYDKHDDFRKAPVYMYLCAQEKPKSFITPYGDVGIEYTGHSIKLIEKNADPQGNSSRSGEGQVLNVLWR